MPDLASLKLQMHAVAGQLQLPPQATSRLLQTLWDKQYMFRYPCLLLLHGGLAFALEVVRTLTST